MMSWGGKPIDAYSTQRVLPYTMGTAYGNSGQRLAVACSDMPPPIAKDLRGDAIPSARQWINGLRHSSRWARAKQL